MAKWANTNVMDQGLTWIQSNASQMLVCAGQPVDRADALTKALASVAMTGGDYTLAAGDVSGRKLTAAQKSGVSVTTSGTADHVAHISATDLMLVTTCTAQALTSGNTVTIPAHADEIRDPT